MDIIEQETDEERVERIQKWRLQRALVEAPELLAHVRSIAVSGRSERGETLGEWTAPMRITAADDVDDVYGQLIDWVMWAAEELKLSPASVSVVAWSIDEKVHGFRAETTIEAARLLTSINTGWMLAHEAELEGWANYATFRDDVLQLLWRLRAKYPMQQRRERSTEDRECPACGDQAVSAEWFSDSMHDVEVSCAACGFELEAHVKVRIGTKRVGVLDLLDWETRENRECTCRYPGDPGGDCPVHHALEV
jgi:transcription elongation factor Elf1